jgi:hypothetical protein
MKRTYWILGACLSLLLVGGFAFDASAQSAPPSTPPAAAPSTDSTTKPDATPQPPAPSPGTSGQMRQDTPQPPTSINTIERSEKTTVVERDGGKIFGMQPTVAMILGAVVLVVIVLGLVAMSRRTDTTEVHHTRI